MIRRLKIKKPNDMFKQKKKPSRNSVSSIYQDYFLTSCL